MQVMPELRCQAQKSVPGDGRAVCGTYLGRVPYPVRFGRVVPHANDADIRHLVFACQCGALNEFVPDWRKEYEDAA